MPVSVRAALGMLAGSALLLGTASHAGAQTPSKSECIASNEEAQDLEHAGKLREARSKLALCVAATCPGAVRKDCAERLAAIGPRVPSLLFDVKDRAGNNVTDVHVTVDGEALAHDDGTPVEIDPGKHRITFEAEGHATVEKTLVVTEGDKERRLAVVMTSSRQAKDEPEPIERAKDGASSPSVPTRTDGSGQRTAGLILFGVSGAGIVIGSVVGLTSKSTFDHALQSECAASNPNACSPQGANNGRTAHTQAAISTAAFVTAGAAAVAGAALYFTAPKSPVTVGASIDPRAARLEVMARW